MSNEKLLEIKREQFARNWALGRDQTGSRCGKRLGGNAKCIGLAGREKK
jgi:hypothetical protein